VAERLYVATGADGIERTPSGDVVWSLPGRNRESTPGDPVVAKGPLIVLRRATALLDALDERVFVVEPLADVEDQGDRVLTSTARLVSETDWGVETAARFALDCAAHALIGNEDEALPDGTRLVDVIREARETLERVVPANEERIGFLARLAALRRLRRLEDSISGAELESTTADLGNDLDAVDDPAWARLASCSEAVLAALEALRRFALPRYVHSREESVDEHPEGAPPAAFRMLMTPWGEIGFGAEHQSPYEPAWAEARDAANRAREAARDRGGESALREERDFQAALLERLLATGSDA
jgi:hypothetical protein